jgi:hypothetical protein
LISTGKSLPLSSSHSYWHSDITASVVPQGRAHATNLSVERIDHAAERRDPVRLPVGCFGEKQLPNENQGRAWI